VYQGVKLIREWLQCGETSSAPDSDGGRMSAAQRRRALSVFPNLKVANFALLLSVNTKLQPASRRSGATLLDNPRYVIN